MICKIIYRILYKIMYKLGNIYFLLSIPNEGLELPKI